MVCQPHSLVLPATLCVLVSHLAAATQPAPIAIRKQVPDSNEKIFPDHLAFAPLPRSDLAQSATFFTDESDDEVFFDNGTARFYPSFARHFDESEDSILRRAAQALSVLQKRATCPSGMSDCSGSNSPNKCCQQGTYCTEVNDPSVGNIACCPNGSTCGGNVGKCPSGATSCPQDLGGGCCIPGYICQGVGCIPSASATAAPKTSTVTAIRTTVVRGSPTTVLVTVTVIASQEPTTETRTTTVAPSGTASATETTTEKPTATGIVPPWRPTGTSEATPSSEEITTKSYDTQTGCPTGFYGCLATHGGGCCRTDRDCQTYSCPAPSSTTIVSDGRTIVVPATNLPSPSATATCAGGWFLCGKDAGSLPGCCPSGYECGTASCSTAGSTETGKVQKQAPKDSAASSVNYNLWLICFWTLLAVAGQMTV